MNKVKNTLLAVAFVLPAILITSCKDDDDNGWSDAEVEELVSECVEDESGTKEQCECFANKVTDTYSKEELDSEDDLDFSDVIKILEFAEDCDVSLSFE